MLVYKLYLNGGYVRDQLLGIESNDIDYTVVFDKEIINSGRDLYREFLKTILIEGYDVFESKRSCMTIRARFPKNHSNEGQTADFVIARKELYYPNNVRVPVVGYGSLEDDLKRRDYTINAMVIDENDELIDLFNGVTDLNNKILRTPTDTAISFNSDPLRILRGFRFAVTHDFNFSDEIIDTIKVFNPDRMDLVSPERTRNELRKMFKFNTKKSLDYMYLLKTMNSGLYDRLFDKNLWFEPTFRQK